MIKRTCGLACSLTLLPCLGYGAVIPDVSPAQVAPPAAPAGPVAPEPSGASVYAKAARAVVLIVCRPKTGDGTIRGSGSIIGPNGLILTNVHVVKGASACFAILKPAGYAAVEKDTPIYPLRLLAADPTKDLALGTMASAPKGLPVLAVGRLADIEIGQEVHAIGHPVGNNWTYTKGVVSQIRMKEQANPPFVADVIQTQTPISPGNSGGPLLSGAGKIIGVNTYVLRDAQNINFAVAASEVEAFLQRVSRGEHLIGTSGTPGSEPPSSAQVTPGPQSPPAAKAAECENKVLGEKPSKRIPGKTILLDIGCTGEANAVLLIPDDPQRERILYVSTQRAEPGAERYYDKRYYIDPKSGKIIRSWHDVDRDGRPDFMGIHRDGEAEPSEFLPFSGSVGLRDP